MGRVAWPKRWSAPRPGRLTYMNSAPPLLRVQGWIGNPSAGRRSREAALLAGGDRVLEHDPGETRSRSSRGSRSSRTSTRTSTSRSSCSRTRRREAIQAWLAGHPVSFPIAYDYEQQLYQDYAIAKLQLPHAKLIGLDGSVVWEGNPDYKAEYGSYLDEPLADLVAKSKLAELRQAQKSVADAEAALQRGDFSAAITLFQPVSKIEAVHPAVAAARDGLARIESEADRRIGESDAFAKDGRLLQAAKVLEEVVSKFTGIAAGEKAKRALEKLSAGSPYKNAKKLDNRVRAPRRAWSRTSSTPRARCSTEPCPRSSPGAIRGCERALAVAGRHAQGSERRQDRQGDPGRVPGALPRRVIRSLRPAPK